MTTTDLIRDLRVSSDRYDHADLATCGLLRRAADALQDAHVFRTINHAEAIAMIAKLEKEKQAWREGWQAQREATGRAATAPVVALDRLTERAETAELQLAEAERNRREETLPSIHSKWYPALRAAELSRDEWKQKAEELSDLLEEAKQLEREMWKDSGAESWAQYAIDLAKDRDEWKAKAEKAIETLERYADTANWFMGSSNRYVWNGISVEPHEPARACLASLGLASGEEGGE